MNEEEKQAIKELKNFKSDKDCKFWIGLNGEKAIDIIINLIEKQSKEIEHWKAGMKITEKDKNNHIEKLEKKINEIEDKIKAKIEELDKEYKEAYNKGFKTDMVNRLREIKLMQSLLEKGNENE